MLKDFNKVLIVGAGFMGRAIAQACAIGGYEIFIMDKFEQCLKVAEKEITRGLFFLSEKKMIDQNIKKIIGKINYRLRFEDLTDSFPLIIEAITEDLSAKRNLFEELENKFSRKTIFASNTSSFPISRIANKLKHKERVIGIHFIAPAQINPVVEIIKGKETSNDTISMAIAFCKKINKKPIIVNKEITGFVVNRLQGALNREAYYLINSGISTPEEIDLVIKLGLAPRFLSTGLFEQRDIAGIDVAFAVANQIYPDLCNESAPHQGILEKLIEKGYLGIKTGRGFYDWGKVDFKKHIEEKLQIQIDALKLLNV